MALVFEIAISTPSSRVTDVGLLSRIDCSALSTEESMREETVHEWSQCWEAGTHNAHVELN
jgi:hypothetical protein